MAKKTVEKKKSGDQMSTAKKSATSQTKQGKSADKVKRSKSSNSSSQMNAISSSQLKTSSSSQVPQAGHSQSMSTARVAIELETVRKRLRDLDIECREKADAAAMKNTEAVYETVEQIREQATANVEKAIKELQEQYNAEIEASHQALEKQQKEELALLLEKEKCNESEIETKRAAMEKEIAEKKDQTEKDIVRYRAKKEADRDEQIKRLQEQICQLEKQCEKDIADYAERRQETNMLLLDQLNQRLEIELKNQAQRGSLNANLKAEEVKARYTRAHREADEKLNRSMAMAMAALRTNHESQLDEKLAQAKVNQQAGKDKARARIEEEYREERYKLVAEIEEMESKIKGSLVAEQRELERRLKKKAQLLIMLGMDDTNYLPDEDLVGKRFKFKIARGQIVVQSSASTVYVASQESGGECFCKVTMMDKWSVVHRLAWAKNHSTRLARYLTETHEKAPYFVKVINILATEQKVYAFMEPLPSTLTLLNYLEAITAKLKKVSTSSTDLRSGMKKSEMVNVLSQVIKAVSFLDNVFVAHTALMHSNITIIPSDAQDLTTAQIIITGLTRPIVFFNPESDELINVKGFDPSSDVSQDPMDHLPPECFESKFLPAYVDTYSIGVLAFGMLRLRSPFARMSQAKILAAKQVEPVKLSLDKGEAAHGQLAALIVALTQPNQNKRLPIEDIMGHAYLKQ